MTVGKTTAHLARVRSAQKRERKKSRERSTRWPAARRKHIKAFPECAACGSRVGLQAHHVAPFHLAPERELDPTNLLTLCESVGGLECHEFFGHGANFRAYVPDVRAIASALRSDPAMLGELRKRARTSRKL